MRPHGTIDLETDPFKRDEIPEPFAADFFDGKTHFLFWGPDAVGRCLKAAASFKGLVYAHNGGKFDFNYLMPFLVEMFGPENLEVMCIGSRIVKIKVKETELEFRDSFALIPKPLSSFGNKIDIKDHSRSGDELWKLRREHREQHKREICEYLKQDCSGLWEALRAFIEKYGAEITLASTTFKLLRKDFGFKLPKTTYFHDKKFRQYYFAGRVQFFRLGFVEGRTDLFDINSAFPWAMTLPHWFGAPSMVRLSAPRGKGRDQSFYDVICDANGCLPSRGPKGEVLFPVGRNLRFHVTGWELFAGIECGLIRNVRFNAVYTPLECRDFGDYVRHFYHLKQFAPDEAERTFAKLILNSAYGKFALNCREFKTVRVTGYDEVLPEPWRHSYDDEENGLSYWQKPSFANREKTPEEIARGTELRNRKRKRLLEMPGRSLIESEEEEFRPMRFNNVCTAASITGCVRAFLMRSIHQCRDVVYCDTDSVTVRDGSALQVGDGLGQWKLEKQFDGFWIGGKKLYAGRSIRWREIEIEIAACSDPIKRGKLRKELWKTASKGVRLTPEQIVKVALGEEQKYNFDAPNFSPFSAPGFTTRTIRRDDQRKR